MAASTPSTILLKGDVNRKQREAAGAITPGELVLLGSGDTVTAHSNAGGISAAWVAVENDIAGDDFSHAYATGEAVQIQAAKPGDELYMWLNAAVGLNVVVIGDYLESAGDGTLQEFVADSAGGVQEPHNVIAMALEAVDLSATGAVDTRIKVVII